MGVKGACPLMLPPPLRERGGHPRNFHASEKKLEGISTEPFFRHPGFSGSLIDTVSWGKEPFWPVGFGISPGFSIKMPSARQIQPSGSTVPLGSLPSNISLRSFTPFSSSLSSISAWLCPPVGRGEIFYETGCRKGNYQH